MTVQGFFNNLIYGIGMGTGAALTVALIKKVFEFSTCG